MYTADTEVLTRRGWIPFPRLTLEDQVVTLNKDGLIVLEQPSNVMARQCRGMGSFAEVKSNQVNLLVTRSQKLVFDVGGIPSILQAANYESISRTKGFSYSNWSGGVWSKFENTGFDWYQLLGHFIGSRGVYAGTAIYIYSPQRLLTIDRLIERLQHDLINCGYLSGRYLIEIPNHKHALFAQQYRYLASDFTVSEYTFDLLFGLSNEQLLALWTGFIASYTDNLTDAKPAPSMGELGVVQALHLLAGKGDLPSLYPRQNNEREPLSIKFVEHSGPTYGCSLCTGIIYTRRKGKPCWSGN